jgi:hypothetical protein
LLVAWRSSASTVIANLDQDLAAVFQLDPDVFGAAVEGVLHQFFHDRGWALHYLARGDLVGNSVGQNCNAASHEEIYPPMPATVPAASHPSLAPGARTRVQPACRRKIRTAPPASTGPTSGASPCGDTRRVV